MLQCVAVCCSVLQVVSNLRTIINSRQKRSNLAVITVLQCVAVRCRALQCVAVCCSALQCVAVCCSVLQRVAACCSVLQMHGGAVAQSVAGCYRVLKRACCNMSQRNAVCYHVWQRVAVYCSVMQCVVCAGKTVQTFSGCVVAVCYSVLKRNFRSVFRISIFGVANNVKQKGKCAEGI